MNATPVGALLLCRAEPGAVRQQVRLLRENLLLAPAGDGWSVVVPEGRPWTDDGEPVDAVLSGWAAAAAVGTDRPALALWWDGDRSGFTLVSGFRRPVGYVWLADGTPVGEDEAMRTFAARLGLDPVLDLQALEPLTLPDPEADADARMTGLVAVLARAGLDLPEGLAPGQTAEWLRAAARARGAEHLAWSGWRDAVEEGALEPWLHGPGARVLGTAQLAAGLPLGAWALSRRSPGWAAAAGLLVAHGVLGLLYARLRTPGA
ncbi:hypothetical protein [Streptomyces genisteinicus]|uniref:Uncharacterized protein n=1 Tax=Streptomyces genisteinicus TaxID=2768068 RepID=A0A7H0HXJ3_9ACTN|nr:hypothetical protein [Streptomyces genisteinicus]QNP65259.1 hypothetical protein IAG43_21585 [Streptomyces genisteinicus]